MRYDVIVGGLFLMLSSVSFANELGDYVVGTTDELQVLGYYFKVDDK